MEHGGRTNSGKGTIMRIGKTRALRIALYGIALTALLMAIILPTVAAKSPA